MAARDDTDLEEALEILSNRVEENNREVEESLENIYGDLEDHEDQIIELAHYARHNRDRIEENYENIDDLWLEIDDIYDELDDAEGGDGNSMLSRRQLLYVGGAAAGGGAIGAASMAPWNALWSAIGGYIGGKSGAEEEASENDETPTGGDPIDTPDSEYGEDIQTFTYDGNKAIDDDEFGGYDELLDEYGSNAALEEMLTEDYTDGNVFVAENDRVYAGGGQASVRVDGVWEDVKDGEVDGQ